MDHNPAQEINPHIPAAARWIGATPLVVFLAVYLLTSLILRDFYAMPITVAFLIASVYAVAITRGLSTEKRVLRFSRGDRAFFYGTSARKIPCFRTKSPLFVEFPPCIRLPFGVLAPPDTFFTPAPPPNSAKSGIRERETGARQRKMGEKSHLA